MAASSSIVPDLPPFPSLPARLPARLCEQPAEWIAAKIVDKGRKLPPLVRDAAIARKARELAQAREDCERSSDPEIVRRFKEESWAYYVTNILPRQRPVFERGDFPPAKPAHCSYSEKSYERFLTFMTGMPIPRQSATQEDLQAKGFPSWKAFTVAAALDHWHPRVNIPLFKTRISYLPDCAPASPPRPLPRRSWRLARKTMSEEERYWSD